jgi:hypothetical protein
VNTHGCPTFGEVEGEYCSEGPLNPFVDSCGNFTILVLSDALVGAEEGYDPDGNLAFARVCGDTAGFCAGREACHVYGEMPDCEMDHTNVRLCEED